MPLKSGVADLERQVCTLSETGWAIWQKLDGVRSLGQVAKMLAEKFSCPEKEIGKDVLGFIAALHGCGLCIPLNSVEPEKQEKIALGVPPPSDHLRKPLLSSFLSLGDLPESEQLELLCLLKERGMSVRTSGCGSSMAPFIGRQDILTITWQDNTPLRVGQVVVFKHWGCEKLLIHRIIRKGDSGWVTKGDNCLNSDGDIPTDDIFGLVTHVERHGKRGRVLCARPESKIAAFLNRTNFLILLRKLWNMARRLPRRLLNRK